jgi:ADP-heptose:LPS heptosyltransferase
MSQLVRATPTRILVIKFGAFGNIVLSMGAFAAIRAHHPTAEITVLTTPPYADWLRAAPYFDRVMVADRVRWWDVRALWRLRGEFAAAEFSRVYDLQTSGRSSRYLWFFPFDRRPEWSGVARGCSHPDLDPDRDDLHDMDRQAGQLRQAGIDAVPAPDLSWCVGNIGRFGLSGPLALLIPGSSARRPGKRWPAARYGALAVALRTRGLTPVVIDSESEGGLARACPAAVDLTGRTAPGDLCDLGRTAAVAIGNDTGPTHLMAVVGCPTITLFSHDSDPALCAPRGTWTRVLRRPDLATLTVAEVLAELPR